MFGKNSDDHFVVVFRKLFIECEGKSREVPNVIDADDVLWRKRKETDRVL